MFPKFNVGEWIILADHMLSGFGGFISEYDYEDGMYFIELTTTKSGEQISAHLWVSEWCLIRDEVVLDETEIKQLMDLALDTKDEAWFHELSEQIQLCSY
jgi:hypothetical protein